MDTFGKAENEDLPGENKDLLWYTLVDDIRTSGEKLSELKNLLDGGAK